MKYKMLLVAFFIMLYVLAVFSKHGGEPAGSEIIMQNIYLIRLSGDTFLVTELVNCGRAKIKAFQGRWIVKDDLDDKVAENVIKYTSDSLFLSTNGLRKGHIIEPGEQFSIVQHAATGESDEFYLVEKSEVGPYLRNYLGAVLPENYRVTKKTEFELEKIVLQ